MVEVHPDPVVVYAHMFWDWPVLWENRRHVLQIIFSRESLVVLTCDLRRLLHAFLVRVAVLLEPLDAVVDFWAAEPCEQGPSLYDADVHDCGVQTLHFERRRKQTQVRLVSVAFASHTSFRVAAYQIAIGSQHTRLHASCQDTGS